MKTMSHIHEPVVHSVRAVATYAIPLRSETIIQAKLGQCLTPEVEGLIEPGPQLVRNYSIQGATTRLVLRPTVT